MWFLYGLAVIFIIGLLAYLYVPPVKSAVDAVWFKWFKSSEVNALSDIAIAAGSVIELLDDPSVTEWLTSSGLAPKWLIIIGVVIRLARMSRNWGMVPLTKE